MKAMILAAMLIPAVAAAQVPGAMSFQGRLLKSDGSAETGTPKITFRIYDAGSGGTEKWSEEQDVKLTNGFYAVLLGSVKPFTADVFNGSARWLGVQIAGDSEMVPRQYIATVPYAFKAAKADVATSLSSGGGGIVANSDGTVTAPTMSLTNSVYMTSSASSVFAKTSGTGGLQVGTNNGTGDLTFFAGGPTRWTVRASDGAMVSSGATITNLPTPSAGSDAATKGYVDAANALTNGTSGIVWATGWTPETGNSVIKTSNGLVIVNLRARFSGTNNNPGLLVCTLPTGYQPLVGAMGWAGLPDAPSDTTYRFTFYTDGKVYVLGTPTMAVQVSIVFAAGN